MMSSPGLSGESSSSSGNFHSLWTQLRECHHSALQELQAKVNELKKKRCSDAEVVERMLKDNRLLKGQNKALQETVASLEERLRDSVCDRCCATEERLRTKQGEFEAAREQSLRLIAELTEDRNSLGAENRKLNEELDRLKASLDAQLGSCGEQEEEGVIPDSPPKHISGPPKHISGPPKRISGPVKHLSGPVMSKKRRRGGGTEPHIPDKDERLSQTESTVLIGLSKGSSKRYPSPKKEVLVPETCDMDTSLAPCPDGPEGAVVAETCCLDVPGSPVKHLLPAKGLLQTKPAQTCQSTLTSRSSSTHGSRHGDRTRTEGTLQLRSSSPVFGKSLSSPEDTSPSLLRVTKLSRTAKQRQRLKEQGIHGITSLGPLIRTELEREKRRAESREEGEEEGSISTPADCSHAHGGPQKALVSQLKTQTDSRGPGPEKHPSTPSPTHQNSKQKTANPEQHDFKKPIRKSSWEGCEDLKQSSVLLPAPCARPLLDHSGTAPRTPPPDSGQLSPVEPVWSMDPGLVLSQPDTLPSTIQPGEREEMVDLDNTFVSHSLLLRGLHQSGPHQSVPGIGHKANDSLAEIFDQTTFGEYESDIDQQDIDDEEEEEEEEERGEGDVPKSPHRDQSVMGNGDHQDIPAFAHVAVVRKREERRKLKGHTCKECEIYYADLPEAERLKKLSACSRHRFRHIPPSTPEHFWEVGFPSTQTCVERGYMREEKEPEQRSRRRRPYNAIFSPKVKEQKTSPI